MMHRRIWRLPWAKMIQTALTFWLFVVAVLVQFRPKSYSAIFANATLFVGFLWLSVLLHELGHAAMARALGHRVTRVTLGTGAPVLTLRFGQTTWRVGAIPFAGRTQTVPRDQDWFRLRTWLIVAAGPFVNLVLTLAAGQFVETNSALMLAPARMLQVASGFVLVCSLFPVSIAGYPSDGLLLLLIWRMGGPALHDVRAAAHHEDCLDALNAGRIDDASEACRLGLLESPGSIALRNAQGLIALRAGSFWEAHRHFRELAAEVPPELRAVLENNMAFASVFLDDDGLLEEAERISRRILAHSKLPSFRGTRGAILVLRGKPRAALRHLHRAYEGTVDDHGLAHDAAWIAAARGALGEEVEAQRWLELAESLDPTCPSLPRVRELSGRSRRARAKARSSS